MLPHWFDKKLEKQNARSKAQERQIASLLGGRVQAGSGSSWRASQDVKSDEELAQVKYTDKGSFVLKVSEMREVAKDASLAGRMPCMIVDFAQHGVRATITFEEML